MIEGKKRVRRILTFMLALAMCLTMLPGNAYATDTESATKQDSQEVEQLDDTLNTEPETSSTNLETKKTTVKANEDVLFTLEGCRFTKEDALTGTGNLEVRQSDLTPDGIPNTLRFFVYDFTAFKNSLANLDWDADAAGYNFLNIMPDIVGGKDANNPTLKINGTFQNPIIVNLKSGMYNHNQGGWNWFGIRQDTPYILVNQIPKNLSLGAYSCIKEYDNSEQVSGVFTPQWPVSGDIRNSMASAAYTIVQGARHIYQTSPTVIDKDGASWKNAASYQSIPTVKTYYTIDIAPVTEGYNGTSFNLGTNFSMNAGAETYPLLEVPGYGTQLNAGDYAPILGGATLQSDVRKATEFYQGHTVAAADGNTYKASNGTDDTLGIDDTSYTLGTGISSSFNRGTNPLDKKIDIAYKGDTTSRAFGTYGTKLPTMDFNGGKDATNPFNADRKNGYVVDYVDVTIYDPATGVQSFHKKMNETEASKWLAANQTLNGRTEIRVAYKKQTFSKKIVIGGEYKCQHKNVHFRSFKNVHFFNCQIHHNSL